MPMLLSEKKPATLDLKLLDLPVYRTPLCQYCLISTNFSSNKSAASQACKAATLDNLSPDSTANSPIKSAGMEFDFRHAR
uniref:Uncharacterized protein n=1 Tax=Oryza nivara TaxID=4536 RepID=A0A0E0HIB1_ORYNI